MNSIREFFTSVVRTVVPAIVGGVMAYLATTSLEVDPQFETNLTVLLTVLFNAVYYVAARFLETKFSDKFGWLLGVATQPVYTEPVTVEQVNKKAEEFFTADGKG